MMIKNRFLSLAILILLFCHSGCNKITAQNINENIKCKVDSLLQIMSLEEKVGQMLNIGLPALLQGPFYSFRDTLILDTEKVQRLLVKYGAGSVQNLGSFPMTSSQWRQTIGYIQKIAKNETRLGIPILYGIDAVHGANYTAGSVMFPHQINIAASFDTSFARQVGCITSNELKACAIPWNYAPVLDVARYPMWGRMFESFGEDPYLVTKMGSATIEGMQGKMILDSISTIACAKHFLGYGASYNGKDRSPVFIPENYLRQVLLPPFKEAIDKGLLSIMISSGSLNGTPSHCDYNLITRLLKEELDFKGVVISDWNDIDNLYLIHKVAKDEREAVKLSVLAGLDMCMEPYEESFAVHLIDLVNSGEVPVERINDAVSRILYLKFSSGLFDDPLFNFQKNNRLTSFTLDSINHHISTESLVLLKNENNVLPFKDNQKVFVTGVAANSINYLNGGWSRTWSGQDTLYNDKEKLTILQALRLNLGSKNVLYAPGTTYLNEINIKAAVKKAKQADIIVVCVGEKPATEKPSDIDELDLPVVQQELVIELQKLNKPIVLVMVQGRPRIIRNIEPNTDAILMAFLPGNEGGVAIADVLLGKVNPSGKLPYTYPKFSGSLWTYDHQMSDERDVNFGLEGFTPQYEFGYGLSYTTFKYSNLIVSSDSSDNTEKILISVDVANTGNKDGKEAALLFISDEVASIAPPVKQLKGFTKVDLPVGTKKTIKFQIDKTDLMFVNQDNKWVFEPGYFNITVGTENKRIYLNNF